MRLAIFGAGLVGRRAALRAAALGFEDVALVGVNRQPEPTEGITTIKGWAAGVAHHCDAAIVATASSEQPRLAALLLRQGRHVVSTADNPRAVDQLLHLDGLAKSRNVTVVVGSGYSPGLSSLLAAWLIDGFDEVFEINTAQLGTGGPICAREHHRAMTGLATEIRAGARRTIRAGSGRALIWFPGPVGGADCFAAGLSEPQLLHRCFPQVEKIQSRQAATRRDRMTAGLPMMRRPHAEGLIGALSVEVRGQIAGTIAHRAVGATGPQATGAASTAVAMVQALAAGGFQPGAVTPGMLDYPAVSLVGVADSVTLWTYDGSTTTSPSGTPIQAAKKWQIGRPDRLSQK